MRDVRKYITQEPAVGEMLCEVVKCIKLLQVVPTTTATAERSFSGLKCLKSYLRSTMGQKRLNNLAVLHAHRDVLENWISDQSSTTSYSIIQLDGRHLHLSKDTLALIMVFRA